MPRMEIDSENCLRMVAGKSKKGSIILGDVAQSFIRALGPSDPPVILSDLRFDEQRWEILASAFGVDVSVRTVVSARRPHPDGIAARAAAARE